VEATIEEFRNGTWATPRTIGDDPFEADPVILLFSSQPEMLSVHKN
jgi:hypothetical protein